MKLLNKYPGQLQWFFILVLLITVGTIIILFYQHRVGINKIDQQESSIDNKTSISIKKLSQTMMRKGKKDWVLDASSADYNDEKKQVHLKDLFITFFLENNKKVTISADGGWLNSESKNIIVSGNVVVKHENSSLTTDELTYQHKQRMISTKVPVKILSRSYQLTADKVSMDLNTNKTIFEGNVRGFFSDRIAL